MKYNIRIVPSAKLAIIFKDAKYDFRYQQFIYKKPVQEILYGLFLELSCNSLWITS